MSDWMYLLNPSAAVPLGSPVRTQAKAEYDMD